MGQCQKVDMNGRRKRSAYKMAMAVLSCQSSHDGGESQLSDTEAQREDVDQQHVGGGGFADWVFGV
jgi:hypothetical protein